MNLLRKVNATMSPRTRRRSIVDSVRISSVISEVPSSGISLVPLSNTETDFKTSEFVWLAGRDNCVTVTTTTWKGYQNPILHNSVASRHGLKTVVN
jgi:hypothetical protein